MFIKTRSLLVAAALMGAPVAVAMAQGTAPATNMGSNGSANSTSTATPEKTTKANPPPGSAGVGYAKIPPASNSSMASGHPDKASNPYSGGSPTGGGGK